MPSGASVPGLNRCEVEGCAVSEKRGAAHLGYSTVNLFVKTTEKSFNNLPRLLR